MLESIEIRWFHKGSLPTEMLNLFKENSNITNQEIRSDYYLKIRNCKNIGVKLRNSRLEIKWRKKGNNLAIGTDKEIKGKIEHWTRWECNDSESCNQLLQIIGTNKDSPWIKIDKNRFQKKFNIIDKSLVQIPANSIKYDYAIEITGLKINQEYWWSIGFDSFNSDNYITYFRQLVQNNLHMVFYPYLRSDTSYGYPEWISKNHELSKLI